MKTRTPIVVVDGVRIPKVVIDYPNKILTFSSYSLEDEELYDIISDIETESLIKESASYEVIYDEV